MFRAVALALVMSLAAGPNVSWVCTVLCDQAAATSDCRHETPAASVVAGADHCCDIAAPEIAGFVPQDVRHSRVSVVSEPSSPVLPSFGLALTGDPPGPGQSPGKVRVQHSLPVALRL